jgi:hypothetical protein
MAFFREIRRAMRRPVVSGSGMAIQGFAASD